MQTKALWVAVVILAASAGLQSQTLPPLQFSVGTALHTACIPVQSVTTYCFADDGPFVSIHGGAWQSMIGGTAVGIQTFNGRKPDASGNITPASGDYLFSQLGSIPAMVMSFNGRTGSVVSATNDYSFSQLSGTVPMKPSFNCATLSFINTANPPFVAGGCQ